MKNTKGIQGVGTDIIEIERIKTAIERHGEKFLERLFTERELYYCQKFADPIPRFAGRFAGKEAVVKAFGTGIQPDVSWKEIEIINDANGKPEVYLSQRLKLSFPNNHIFLSISHCDQYATATAILIG